MIGYIIPENWHICLYAADKLRVSPGFTVDCERDTGSATTTTPVFYYHTLFLGDRWIKTAFTVVKVAGTQK